MSNAQCVMEAIVRKIFSVLRQKPGDFFSVAFVENITQCIDDDKRGKFQVTDLYGIKTEPRFHCAIHAAENN